MTPVACQEWRHIQHNAFNKILRSSGSMGAQDQVALAFARDDKRQQSAHVRHIREIVIDIIGLQIAVAEPGEQRLQFLEPV